MGATSLFDLSGKTALVTGCNKGIGKAMAIALAEAGADIIGISATMETSGREVIEKVKAAGRKCAAYNADLTERASLYDGIARIKKDHPQVDILVNNAGMILRQPAAEHTDEYWDKVLSINLDSTFILAREFGKEMIARRSGKIIFTCSLLSFQGGINVPGYTASKSAVNGLVKALANEWAPHHVNVNGIAPGYIETDNTEALRNDPERSKAILSRIPAGRWGQPDDFGGAVVFLASSASDYVHGTTITVDGGWMGR